MARLPSLCFVEGVIPAGEWGNTGLFELSSSRS